ncbi:hypothetical protein CsSME_00019906 [Camellia sinensis var. sinensis]
MSSGPKALFDFILSRIVILGKKNYIVLKEADIDRRQGDDIVTVSTVLSISEVAASILLRHYHWSVSNVHEAWFADEVRVRKTVGLVEWPVVQYPNSKELTCGICFENHPLDRISTAACGHPFCSACWRVFLMNLIGVTFQAFEEGHILSKTGHT